MSSPRQHSLNMDVSTLNWISLPQMIIFNSLKLIHKISLEKIPPALTQYLQCNNDRSNLTRIVRKPSAKEKYKSAVCKNAFIHRSIYIYNLLPFSFITLNKKQFAIQIKEYIPKNYDLRTIPKIPD